MIGTGKHGCRQKILLVDDDAISLEVLELLLLHEGHHVTRRDNAEGALDLLSSERTPQPDVILVDLQMPGVSGGELAARVRASGRPVPLLLAMSATEAQRQQLRHFDGFLLKPISAEAWRKVLHHGRRGKKIREADRRGADKAVSDEVVDISVIEKLLTMMPLDALQDTVAACIADTRTSIQALEKQAAGEGVQRLAHRIKGAASMIGAVRLARLAAGLESGGSQAVAAPVVLNDLLNACSELERMLLSGNLTKI
jgi:CheY-like chemotaxis protein